MSNKDRLERQLNRMLGSYQPVIETTSAKLGNGAGIVEVFGREGYVYARVGNVLVQVFNDSVPNVSNYPVLIGYDPTNPDLLQVLSTHKGSVATSESGETVWPGLEDHHKTHEWMNPEGGEDTVFIQQRQIMPTNVIPMTGTAAVMVYRGVVPDLEGGWSYVDQTYIDLSGTAPTGTLARYMLLSAQTDGTILIQTGSIKSESSLFLSDIPTQHFGTFPLAAIRVRGSQTSGIQETIDINDVADLRFFPFIRSSGTVGIYDDDIFEGNVRNLNFSHATSVEVTGTFANIRAIYPRVGEPNPLTTVTGGYWQVPDQSYVTGSLSVFLNGLIQVPVIDFVEQFASSGTFQYIDALPTGSVHVTMYGVG